MAIRHDWGQTLTELVNENYLTPMREWAPRHGTLFRSQTYGIAAGESIEQRAGGSAGRRRLAVAYASRPHAGRLRRAISMAGR